ncbi:unnamed protein product, partial [Meganyctiphanes norvegica]
KAAEQQQAKLSKAEQECKEAGPGSSTRFISIDLQQTLTCPRLNNQRAYFRKKFNYHNFCIYDLNSCKANCFLWDETMAMKGSNEINSCLLKWIELNKSDGFKDLVIFADNCAGQNKNIYVILNCLRLLHLGDFDSIKIEFMVAGHSYMPCDRAFGSIETKIRKQSTINNPDEYATLIQTATAGGINVVKMAQEDFFDVKALKSLITLRRPKKFLFTEGRTFTLVKTKPWHYHIKNNKGSSEYVDLEKARKGPPAKTKNKVKRHEPTAPLLTSDPLVRAYSNEIKIDESKLEHLLQLREFLHRPGKEWLDRLVVSQRTAVAVTEQADSEETPVLDNDNAQDEDLLFYVDVTPPDST